MNIGLTGASGFIGREIITQALTTGDRITAFSRRPEPPVPGAAETRSFGSEPDLSSIEAMIQLAGESVFGLWTPRKKKAILESRVQAIRALVRSIKKHGRKTLVVASGVGIYGDRGDEVLTESSRVGDHGFLRDVALAIEREAAAAAAEGARVVNLRIAMVLGPRAGAVAIMSPIFRSGLGGRLGSGKQWMPWIHVSDVARLFLEAAKNSQLSGPLNASAPHPVPNHEFTKIFGSLVQKPTVMPAPAFMLKALLRDESSLLLDSQRIVPEKATASGFTFRYPDLREALADALK
jgi:uncharacterized protein